MMRSIRTVGFALAFALLFLGTVLVFQTFDRYSHSASDTLRPFLITMFPVWMIALASAWALLHQPSPNQ